MMICIMQFNTFIKTGNFDLEVSEKFSAVGLYAFPGVVHLACMSLSPYLLILTNSCSLLKT